MVTPRWHLAYQGPNEFSEAAKWAAALSDEQAEAALKELAHRLARTEPQDWSEGDKERLRLLKRRRIDPPGNGSPGKGTLGSDRRA